MKLPTLTLLSLRTETARYAVATTICRKMGGRCSCEHQPCPDVLAAADKAIRTVCAIIDPGAKL